MDLRRVIVQISFLIIFGQVTVDAFVNAEERKCKYIRIQRQLKVRCYDMNLKEVPQHLTSSVEILDLSFNRIKKLKRSSFQPYRKVKSLIIYENMIQSVEPGTFEHLKSLEEIDLSNNALLTVPLEIFQLPSLRNLYVDSNDLSNLPEDLEGLEKPIRAPLEYINMADCSLYDLPHLGVLPRLWHINVSSNPLTSLSVEKLALMCRLTSVDMTKTLLTPCACQQVNNHLLSLRAKQKFAPVCLQTLDESVCPSPLNRTVYSETFRSCENALKVAERNTNLRYIFYIIGAVIASALLAACWYYKCCRKKKKKRRPIVYSKNRVISPKNTTNNALDMELLNCDKFPPRESDI